MSVRRLYSTFAHGSAGTGLLLIRLVTGLTLVIHAWMALRADSQTGAGFLHAFSAALGILLLAGLWTPIAGGLVALTSIWAFFSQGDDRWYCVMVGALGLALTLLGPGAWSVDARLFGWKRIEIPDSEDRDRPSN